MGGTVVVSTAPESTTVEIISDPQEAWEISDEWTDLAERSWDSEPFLTAEWNRAWWEAFGAGEMVLVTVRRAGRLVAVGPFHIVERRLRGLRYRVLRFWANAYSNRAGIVVDPDYRGSAVEVVVDRLLAPDLDWDVAELEPVHLEGEATRALTKALDSRRIRWGVRHGQSSPYLPLPDSWDALSGSISGSLRRSLRKKRREAEDRADLEIEFGGGSASDTEAAFEIAQHTWQYEAGSGIVAAAENERFYRRLGDYAAERGWLWLAYLHADGVPVSFEYNLKFGGRLYHLKRGYRSGARELSPGVVLGEAVLRRAIEEGAEEYDFLGASERYKLRWTEKVRQVGRLYVFRRGVVPRLEHFVYHQLRPFLKERAPWVLDLKRRLSALLGRGGSG